MSSPSGPEAKGAVAKDLSSNQRLKRFKPGDLVRLENLLTSVRIVCSRLQHVNVLPHVIPVIEAFIWSGASQWTLESASKLGFRWLLDRLLKMEYPGFNQKCREGRLQWAVHDTIRHGYDVQVVEWWLRRYMPDQTLFSMADVYALAIQYAHLPMLQWICQETQGKLPHVESSVYCSDLEVVVWLFDHGDQISCAGVPPYSRWKPGASFESIKRYFAYQGAKDPLEIQGAERMIAEAVETGHLKVLQWIYEKHSSLFDQYQISHALRFGQLQVAKWLQEKNSEHYFFDPNDTFQISSDASQIQYDLDLVHWVASEFEWADATRRLDWMDQAIMFAAATGKLEILEFVYKMRMEILKTDGDGDSSDSVLTSSMMDEAAANGHLVAVQWLHDHSSQGCTTSAMDGAAQNGHLEVVQWLHQNRSEGCTTEAIDQAAAAGHLEIVQWLDKNRSEGCSSQGMDRAAQNGHLNVVQWLHEYRTEGCTTNAMDSAAASGHLEVVQFLHKNRHEGCTSDAQEFAAARGHYETFIWLQENRSEPFDPDMIMWQMRGSDAHKRILKVQALYTKHDRLGWFLDHFIECNDFETAEVLLSKLFHEKGIASLQSRFIDLEAIKT